MPYWNLLILPLAAGYYLLVRFKYFRYTQQRLGGQRLIFNSILLGILLIVLIYILRFLFDIICPCIIDSIYSKFPIKIPYLGTTFSSLIISVLISEIGNKFIERDEAIKKSIKYIGNELELILESSFTEKKFLQFSLDNGKFYIAKVKELPIPSVSNYTRVIPYFSGYRKENKELVFTTKYTSVYNEYIKEKKVEDVSELDVELIIPLDNIVTVSFFDLEMYGRFNPYTDIKK